MQQTVSSMRLLMTASDISERNHRAEREVLDADFVDEAAVQVHGLHKYYYKW